MIPNMNVFFITGIFIGFILFISDNIPITMKKIPIPNLNPFCMFEVIKFDNKYAMIT